MSLLTKYYYICINRLGSRLWWWQRQQAATVGRLIRPKNDETWISVKRETKNWHCWHSSLTKNEGLAVTEGLSSNPIADKENFLCDQSDVGFAICGIPWVNIRYLINNKCGFHYGLHGLQFNVLSNRHRVIVALKKDVNKLKLRTFDVGRKICAYYVTTLLTFKGYSRPFCLFSVLSITNTILTTNTSE